MLVKDQKPLYLFIPNAFSLMRIFFSFMIPFSSFGYERASLFLAIAITDFLDGFLARRWNARTALGVLLDPIADKWVAIVSVLTFSMEGFLSPSKIFAIGMRDISLLLFYVALRIWNRWNDFQIRSFYLGKVTTALQFLLFFLLSWGKQVHLSLYIVIGITGLLSLCELFFLAYKEDRKKSKLII